MHPVGVQLSPLFKRKNPSIRLAGIHLVEMGSESLHCSTCPLALASSRIDDPPDAQNDHHQQDYIHFDVSLFVTMRNPHRPRLGEVAGNSSVTG